MKQFLIWLGITLAFYAGLTFFSHFFQAADPVEVIVAVDVSAGMEEYKSQLPQALSFLNQIRYARFKLVTNSPNKELKVIHDWQSKLELDKVLKLKMYAVFSLDEFAALADLAIADRVIIVTNAEASSLLQKIPKAEILKLR